MLAAESYECPGCGAADMSLSDSGQAVCNYCGLTRSLSGATGLRQTFEQGMSLSDYGRNPRSQLSRLFTTALAVDCEGCGADLVFEPPDTLRHCPFCNRQMLTLPRPVDPALPPMALIPFQVTQQDAQKTLRDALKPYRFNPNRLASFFWSRRAYRVLIQAQPVGIYLPFWLYDCDVTVDYTARIKYISLKAGASWEQETIEPYTHKVIAGQCQDQIRNQLICATQATDVGIFAQWLMEFEVDQLKPYQPQYLNGVKVYRYQLDALDGFEACREELSGGRFDLLAERALKTYQQNNVPDILCASADVETVKPTYKNVRFRQILLPVWVVPPTGAQTMPLLINGNTGELFYQPAKVPKTYSARKLLLVVLFLIGYGVIVSRLALLAILFPLFFPLIILLMVVLNGCMTRGIKNTIDNDLWPAG